MAPRNPVPTVDVVVETSAGIVLVERANEPLGWALPGGFVDYGERLEDAARREVREETGLDVELTNLLGVYSDPSRDPRQHTVTTVYVGHAQGEPRGGDDARRAVAFQDTKLPSPLCFDHARILDDYRRFRATGERPPPWPHAPGATRPLTAKERATLLEVARDALESAITGRPARPIPGETEGRLRDLGACFVTLRAHDGELRGCIGSLDARAPLNQVVREMTAASALRDPRFAPIGPTELRGVRISLSVLAPRRAIRDPNEVVVGRHGLAIRRGPQQGVLLPQVAVELGWSREQFLSHTCLKAGLSPDAWRQPGTTIEIFEGEVFG